MDSLNAEMAVPACRKALGEHGDDPKYSYLLARSLYQNNDNEESFRLANSACERSYAAACQLAGQLLEEGFGPNASAVAAVEKYQRAINLGALFAADSLGNLKWRGADGVAQDKAGAINLFERAAAAGFPPADEALADAYAIGDGVERNAEKAFTHYAIAATMLESKGYSSEIVDQAIARRGTIARSMDPSIVARIWRESVLPLISRK
jgi:TPR repeat protein